jgi:molecular chaperone DnaK
VCLFAVYSRPFQVVAKPDGRPAVQVTERDEAKSFAAEELSAMVLTKMKQTAEQYLGKNVK